MWVAGPRSCTRARARHDLVHRNGYVGALFAGNAVAVHDIEAAIFGTTLGMTEHGRDHRGRPRAAHAGDQRCGPAGSIAKAVEQGIIDRRDHACAGDARACPSCSPARFATTARCPACHRHARGAGRNAERHTKATWRIMVATALHAIAMGNMLPAFVTARPRRLRR